jgi:formylglycine-generating enzyme required for sulfatase activity
MVFITGGQYNGRPMKPFYLGKNPVTNAEYRAHVDRYLNHPFVLLKTDPETHEISVVCREPELAKGWLKKELKIPKDWDTRDPFLFGVFTLFELRKDVSPEGFDRPNQPVVNVSWFHAFEYCVSNGFFLPSDDQWSYAAGVHENRKYATSTGELYAADGKTRLAHFDAKETIDVNALRYPDGPNGLRHMTGNVWEWTARNPSEKYPYAVRGGSWNDLSGVLRSVNLRSAYRHADRPVSRFVNFGFRVAAATEDSR